MTRDPRMSRRMSNAPRMSVVFSPIQLSEDYNMADEQEGNKTGSLKNFCCNHVKSIVTVILMFGMVFCVVMIVMVHKWNFESNEAKYVSGCLDVAIIGAGFSGSYAAWKMRDLGLNIHVYEMSDHVGGMFHTMHLPEYPDLDLELGVTSYNPEQQPLLDRTIRALQLPLRTSRPPNPDLPTFYLRGTHLSVAELNDDHVPYKLSPAEKNKSPKDLASHYKNVILGDEWYKNELILTTTDQLLLYKQGYQSAVSKAASEEGKSFLADTARWRHQTSNDNAAQLVFSRWDHLDRGKYTGHRAVSGGMQEVPREMLAQFLNSSTRHSVGYNRRLACVRDKHGLYQLIFIKTKNSGGGNHDIRDSVEICTHKVVVAVPPKAQAQIEWKPYDSEFSYRESLESLVEYPVMRVFFIYSSLWRDAIYRKDIFTDLPIRHYKYLGAYDHTNSTQKHHIFMVAEVEAKDLDYLKSLIDLKSFDGENIYMCNDTKYLVADITRQIAKLCNVADANEMPKPEQVIVLDYARNAGTGSWYNWRRGAHWEKIDRNMTKPRLWEDVYFIGGLQRGKVDTVIQNIDNFLKNYFITAQ